MILMDKLTLISLTSILRGIQKPSTTS